MRRLFRQIKLGVHVEVVHLLQGHPLLRGLLVFSLVIVAAALAVGSFLLDDELLA